MSCSYRVNITPVSYTHLSFKPLLNSSAIVGYGSVIKSLAVFTLIQSVIFGVSSNPIISEALSVNLICGLTASASGGLGISLDALAPTYLQMSQAMNISPEILLSLIHI